MEGIKSEFLKLPIIVDIGSGEVKAGLSGQEQPKTTFPNYFGEPKYYKILRGFNKENQEMKEQYIGNDCDKYMGVIKLRAPVQHGVFTDEQDIIPLFNHIFSKLEMDSEEIKCHPILISEPLLNPKKNRENIATCLFDSLNVPALFFASQPILSLFSTSSTSGAVLESGEGVTQSCVVYEGYSIPNSYIRYDYGGYDVTEFLQKLFRKQGYSFNTTSEFQIVKKIKETHCCASVASLDNKKQSSLTGDTGQTNFYLPDFNTIKIGDEKFEAPEILFKPSIIGMEYLSFQEMITTSINKADIDLRTKLFGSILLSGGNTSIKGLREKAHTEIKKLSPKHLKVSVHTPSKPQYCCWTGGNVISTLEIFKKMWVSKKEWDETGKNIIHNKTI